MRRGGTGGRAAAGIQREQLFLLRQPDDGEEVAADARTARLDDVHDGRGRDRGIDRVPAFLEHLESSLRAERLTSRHGAKAREHFGPGLWQPTAGAVAADGSEIPWENHGRR